MSTEPRGRSHLLAACAVLALFAALTVALMGAVDRTADETTYLGAGRAILNEGWSHEFTRLHGPLPFLAAQLFVDELPSGGRLHSEHHPELMFRARLGMLPFGLAAAACVFLWARELYGARAGLVALCLFALHPLMPAYAALIAVDMAYAAGVVGALYLAWRFGQRPAPGRGLCAGAGLGLALATKYLALVIAPFAVVFCGARAALAGAGEARSARSGVARRGARGFGAAALVAATALVALHGTYGFSVGTAPLDPASYGSEAMAGLLRLPVLGPALALLPEPYVRGMDYQLAVGGESFRPYLEGRFAPGHPDYYLWVFLRKTPEWIGLVVLAGLGGALWRWPAGRSAPGERRALALVLPLALTLLVYLSFFTTLQVGVRYALPLYPLAFVVAGGLVVRPWVLRLGRGARSAAVGLALALSLWDFAGQWPNLLAYTNTLSGGQAQAWRYFADSNSDWGQMRRRGREELLATEGDSLVFLTRDAGPRFGRVAIDLRDLCLEDPEHPGRSYHWLHAFRPVRHVGASWWVFDVRPAEWEALVAEGAGERKRAELVTAYLGAGRLEDARRHLPATGERRAPLERLLELLERGPGLSPDEAVAVAGAWTALGRFDKAEAVLRDHPAAREHPLRASLLAQAQMRQFRYEEALATLRNHEGPGTGDEPLLEAELHRRLGDLAGALAALDAGRGSLTGAHAQRAEELRRELERALRREREFERAIEGQ